MGQKTTLFSSRNHLRWRVSIFLMDARCVLFSVFINNLYNHSLSLSSSFQTVFPCTHIALKSIFFLSQPGFIINKFFRILHVPWIQGFYFVLIHIMTDLGRMLEITNSISWNYRHWELKRENVNYLWSVMFGKA